MAEQAYGVELIDKDGYKRIVKANKEVILTAGAIGSPHILMNSGIGPKEHLTKLGMNVDQGPARRKESSQSRVVSCDSLQYYRIPRTNL